MGNASIADNTIGKEWGTIGNSTDTNIIKESFYVGGKEELYFFTSSERLIRLRLDLVYQGCVEGNDDYMQILKWNMGYGFKDYTVSQQNNNQVDDNSAGQNNDSEFVNQEQELLKIEKYCQDIKTNGVPLHIETIAGVKTIVPGSEVRIDQEQQIQT